MWICWMRNNCHFVFHHTALDSKCSIWLHIIMMEEPIFMYSSLDNILSCVPYNVGDIIFSLKLENGWTDFANFCFEMFVEVLRKYEKCKEFYFPIKNVRNCLTINECIFLLLLLRNLLNIWQSTNMSFVCLHCSNK